MKNLVSSLLFLIVFSSFHGVYAQNPGNHFSAVNPALFKYSTEDVVINPPVKQNNGNHLIGPDIINYPWEGQWNNGYPNAVLNNDGSGIVDVYFTLTTHVASPSSDVGIAVLSGELWDDESWSKPSLGVFYWNTANPDGQKLNTTSGQYNTNVIADKIEGMGIYQTPSSVLLAYFDGKSSLTSYNGKKLYGFENSNTNPVGGGLDILLNGTFQDDRISSLQKTFTFPFVQGNTHDKIFKSGDRYLYSARHRVNNPGTNIKPRYRRVIIGDLGTPTSLQDKTLSNSEMNVGLDGYSLYGQPYALQPHKLPGFENDVFFGYTTVYTGDTGTHADEDRQHTELAISNDGKNWKWLKPGTAFIDNGPSGSDDYGTINIATPVFDPDSYFNNDPMLYYYYFGSPQKHDATNRQSGLLLAEGIYGKMAGLGSVEEKTFYSPTGKENASYTDYMLTYNMAEAFGLNKRPYPEILADCGTLGYVELFFYAYDPLANNGVGDILTAVRSDLDYNIYYPEPMIISETVLGNTINIDTELQPRFFLLKHFVNHATTVNPTGMTKLSEMTEVKTVMQAKIENATFYGFAFNPYGPGESTPIMGNNAANYEEPLTTPPWSFYTPTIFNGTSSTCESTPINEEELLPNQISIAEFKEGSFAIQLVPQDKTPANDQMILGMYGNDATSNIRLYYGTDGKFHYELKKGGVTHVDLTISATDVGLSDFQNNEVVLLIEATTGNKFNNSAAQSTDNGIVTSFTVISESTSQEHTEQLRVAFESNPTAIKDAQSRINAYNLFASFVPGLDEIVLGGDENCSNGFRGFINKAEISKRLPSGTDNFYGDGSMGSKMALSSDNIQEEEPTANNLPQELDIQSETVLDHSLNLIVSPNPTRSNLEFSFDLSKSQKVRVEIIDMQGRVIRVLEDATLGKGGYNYRALVETLPSGLYVLKLQTDEGTETKKIIVRN